MREGRTIHRVDSAGHYEEEKFTRNGFTRAIRHYEQAVEYDPEFGQAHAHIGRCCWCLYMGFAVPREQVVDRARNAIEEARKLGVELLPDMPQSRNIHRWLDDDDYDRTSESDDWWSDQLDASVERIR